MKRLFAAAAIGFAFASPAPRRPSGTCPRPTRDNFHTENLQQFATTSTRRRRQAQDPAAPNASLFKAPEIKRAVQGGQAQAGEILLVNFENEDALYGLDGIPFLATSYAESFKLYKASRKALDDKLASRA
jgi:TRAP-type C4-dicarboxylate transport system substrate-binding protein